MEVDVNIPTAGLITERGKYRVSNLERDRYTVGCDKLSDRWRGVGIDSLRYLFLGEECTRWSVVLPALRTPECLLLALANRLPPVIELGVTSLANQLWRLVLAGYLKVRDSLISWYELLSSALVTRTSYTYVDVVPGLTATGQPGDS